MTITSIKSEHSQRMGDTIGRINTKRLMVTGQHLKTQ